LTIKYKTLLANPPWERRQGENPLLTLPTDRIKQLGIALDKIVDNDAFCWLRVTSDTISLGYQVLRAWGFQYRSMHTAIEPRTYRGRSPRRPTEHFLLGVRGTPETKFPSQMMWLLAPIQDHSHSPEGVHVVIERTCPEPRLKLFAPTTRPHWHVWGSAVRSDIDLAGFPVPNSPARRKRQGGGDDE
jgi:N6-adenosine-specific RNA methylase IME4